MKINQINNLSFKRAIKVNSASNRINEHTRVNNSTRAVFYTLYGNSSSMYNEKEFKQISKFLYDAIGDFKKDGLYLRKIDGEIYLFTGKEAKAVSKADRILEKNINQIKKKEDSKELCKQCHKMRDKKLLAMVEDGTNGKPYSEITIDMDRNHKATSIIYLSKNNGLTEEKVLDLKV